MAEGMSEVSCKKQGRPRKSREGWASVNKRIYISDKTFNKWRGLRAERDLRGSLLFAYSSRANRIALLADSHGKSLICDLLCENRPCSHLVVIRETPV